MTTSPPSAPQRGGAGAAGARLPAVDALGHPLPARQEPGARVFCVCCGELATRRDADGVPLCEGDWLHLLDHAP